MTGYLASLVSDQCVVLPNQRYTTHQTFPKHVNLKHFCPPLSDEFGFRYHFEKRHEPWNTFELPSNISLGCEIRKLQIGQLSQWRRTNTDNSPFPMSRNFHLTTDLRRPNISLSHIQRVVRQTRNTQTIWRGQQVPCAPPSPTAHTIE